MTTPRIITTGTYRDVRLSIRCCAEPCHTLRLKFSGRCWTLRWFGGNIISKHESREAGLAKARKILRGQP